MTRKTRNAKAQKHESAGRVLSLRVFTCRALRALSRLSWSKLLLFLLVACGPVKVQQTPASRPAGYWGNLPPLQIARQELGAVALDGRIYAIAGLPLGPVNNSVEVFDLNTSTWSMAAPLPGPVRDHVAAAVAAGRVYVIAGGPIGQPPTDEVWAYNPQTNTWEQRASLPIAVWSPSAATLNDAIYVAGGQMAGGTVVANLYRYDAAANQWTQLASMPTPRHHLALVALDGYLYAVGGRNSGSFTLDALERYDSDAEQWATLPPMPTGRSGHAAAALDHVLIAFGGEGSSQPGGVFAEVEAYDPATNTWASLPDMPTPRHGLMAAVWDGVAYLPGGATVAGFGQVNTFDAFSFAPLSDAWITKTAQPGAALPGQPVTFTLTYGNFGPAIAPNVRVTDTLPGGYAYGGAQPAPTVVGSQLLWPLGAITGTLRGMLTITGTFLGPTAVNVAAISDVPDRNPANNQAQAAITPLPAQRSLYLPMILKTVQEDAHLNP